MVNTTETYWSVDGESLQTYAYNITDLDGGRRGVPSFRGGNVRVPYREGEIWVPKVADTRTINLNMWVLGASVDGTVPRDDNVRRVYESNLRKIQDLFWVGDRLLDLSKKFWVESEKLTRAGENISNLPSSGRWTLYDATAWVEWAGGLDPVHNGTPFRGMFDVTLVMPNPFFYSRELKKDLSSGDTSVFNPGNHHSTYSYVNIQGPMTNPKIKVTSAPDRVGRVFESEMWYNGTIAANERLVIDVDNFTARLYNGDTYTPVAGKIGHSGDKYWMRIYKGDNTITTTADSFGGSVELSYAPAWW